jgi:type II secretory pathway pseudopilin PulG
VLTRRETAFTLVELVIGMILLMIVIGGVIYAVTQLSNGSSSLTANRAAQRDALEAMEQMRHDVSAARSPALEQFTGRRETLRDIVYFSDDSITPDANDRSRNLCGGVAVRGARYVSCMQSITFADRDEIWFRAAVNNVSGSVAECVGYKVVGGELRRLVSSDWRNCGPGVGGTTQTVLLKGNGQLNTSRGGTMFTYTLRYQPGLVQNQLADPAGCRTFRTSAPNQRLTAFISTVDIDLSGFATSRDEGAVAGLTTSSAITAHIAGDYAFATGCAP